MKISWSPRTKAILIQIVVVAGLILWFMLGLPGLRQHRQAARAAEREKKIQNFTSDLIVEDTSRTVTVPIPGGGETSGHPQRLASEPSLDEVENRLGSPQTSSTDFRGGQHLTWIGTRHRLEASFDKGRLYSVTLTNLKTGHGAGVRESYGQWAPF